MNERPILEITPDAVHIATEECYSSPGQEEYLADQFELIRDEQGELYSFLEVAEQQIKDGQAFLTAVAVSYKMVPIAERQQTLTTAQINAVHNSLRESIVRTAGSRATLELNWFLNKMEADSPAYHLWLSKIIEQLEDLQSKKDFTLGSFVTIMPFYMRREAQRMEKLFQ